MSIAHEIPATKPITADPPQASSPPRSQRGDWTWELVTMFPQQGDWTEEQYLSREFEGLVEYSDGVLKFLPMPTWLHQFIVDYLHSQLKQYVQARSLGLTAFAPLRIRIGDRQYREPDVVFVTHSRISSLREPPDGADLVMEVVSDSKPDRDRDFIDKRADYAAAGIPEYWIVDPALESITVLILKGSEYQVHGEFKMGAIATSALLPGFEITTTACFDFQPVNKSDL